MATSYDEVAAVDAELEALTMQLERAKQKKAALARERELREAAAAAAQQQAQQASSLSSFHQQNPQELQRQIDELKRQLELQETELQTAVTIGASYASNDNDDTRRSDNACRMPLRRSTIVGQNKSSNEPPVRPTRHQSTLMSPQEAAEVSAEFDEILVDDDDDDYEEATAAVAAPAPVSAVGGGDYNSAYEPVKGSSELAKQKYAFEKPTWALPSEAIATDESILKDPIQNGLKAAAHGGYERKVHPTDNLALIKGTFVTHQEKIPDPRMVWIVVNIDGCKVGKIVMHLYGNVLPLTDIFLELKGLELKYNTSTKHWYVDDIEPHFYMHNGKYNTFSGPKTACYGVVLEGQDIVQQLLDAVPSGAVVTIKQSHIFPVKKAKS